MSWEALEARADLRRDISGTEVVYVLRNWVMYYGPVPPERLEPRWYVGEWEVHGLHKDPGGEFFSAPSDVGPRDWFLKPALAQDFPDKVRNSESRNVCGRFRLDDGVPDGGFALLCGVGTNVCKDL